MEEKTVVSTSVWGGGLVGVLLRGEKGGETYLGVGTRVGDDGAADGEGRAVSAGVALHDGDLAVGGNERGEGEGEEEEGVGEHGGGESGGFDER